MSYLNDKIKIKTVRCTQHQHLYYSKAGFVFQRNNTPTHFFGFGCAGSKNNAELKAKSECVERFLATKISYSPELLNQPINLHQAQDAECINYIGKIKRKRLLVGQTVNRTSINGTGFALAHEKEHSLHRAISHAWHEIAERHLSYCWWHQRLPLFNDIRIATETDCVSGQLAFDHLEFAYAVAFFCSHELFVIGSASGTSIDRVQSHAEAELAMQIQSIRELKKLNREVSVHSFNRRTVCQNALIHNM